MLRLSRDAATGAHPHHNHRFLKAASKSKQIVQCDHLLESSTIDAFFQAVCCDQSHLRVLSAARLLGDGNDFISEFFIVVLVNGKLSLHKFHFAYIDNPVGPVYKHVDLRPWSFAFGNEPPRVYLRVNSLYAQCPFDLFLMRETDILKRLSAPSIEFCHILVVLPKGFIVGGMLHGKFQVKQAKRIGKLIVLVSCGFPKIEE